MEHLLGFKSHASLAGKLIHQQHKEWLEDLSNKSHSISLNFSFLCPLDLLLKPQPLMPLFIQEKGLRTYLGELKSTKAISKQSQPQRTWNTKASSGAVCTVSTLGSGPRHSLRKWTDLANAYCQWTASCDLLWSSWARCSAHTHFMAHCLYKL